MLDKEILRKTQLIMLDELIELDKICKKNDIDYWLDSGTLLGAIRHKGFIPWDDDIDVCLLENDYNKLLKIIEKEIDNKYFIQSKWSDKYYFIPWIKIRDRNSIMICEENEKFHQGIAIDIFPMKSYSYINKFLYRVLFRIADIKDRRTKVDLSMKTTLKNIILILKVNKLALRILSIFSNNSNRKSFIGYKYSFYKLHKYRDIFPLLEIEFEGHKFSCPNNIDAYLKNLYGPTYMELPPDKDRVWHAKEIRLNEKCFFEKELERTGRKLYEDD